MKYIVTVGRTDYKELDFEVEADDECEAEEKAREMAGNTEFPRGDATYTTENCQLK